VDRDFEAHLQGLFDAPTALEDTEQFVTLIERDLRRMRRTMLWVAAFAAAGAAAGLYLAFDPLWNRWSNDLLIWLGRAKAATPYFSQMSQVGAVLVALIAAGVGLSGGRRA
jgi:hypothetical protein